MLKISRIVWIISLLLLLAPNITFSQYINQEKTFIVTAYYSPLPNQTAYITGTYQWDILNNWRWETTASWKELYEWVLAWPITYPFWTKIYIEWFGVWVIEDRWGDILKAWENWVESDRIDIWMWYGYEWLKRAKKWWNRTVKGIVVSNETDVSIKFVYSNYYIAKWLSVTPESDSETVKKLQELFTNINLYSGEIDWNYENIRYELIQFQIKHWIIENEYSWWAWYFWEQTRNIILEKYVETEPENPLIKEMDSKLDFLIEENHTNDEKVAEKYKIVLENMELYIEPESTEQEVQKLQEIFTKLELYSGEIDWNYDSIKDTLINFQVKHWIIASKDSEWAWYFWNQTKSFLLWYVSKLVEDSKNTTNTKNTNITDEEKEELRKKAIKLKEAMYNLSIKEGKKIKLVRNSFMEKFDKIIEKTTDEKSKEKLKYLKELL